MMFYYKHVLNYTLCSFVLFFIESISSGTPAPTIEYQPYKSLRKMIKYLISDSISGKTSKFITLAAFNNDVKLFLS